MTTTVAADLIVPEVWGPMVMKATLERAVMRPFTTEDSTLQGEPGDTINFPSYGYIGDAEDLTENVAIVPTALSTDEDSVTIKEAGKGVELTDKAILTAMGNPSDEAVRQLSLSMSRKIDSDILAAAYATNAGSGSQAGGPLAASATPMGQLDWKATTLAFAKLGDEWDPAEAAGLVIHSAQQVDLLNDSNFIGIDKFGSDSVILRGQIGRIGNVPIVVSDRVKKTGTAEDTVYQALLIMRGALVLAHKRTAIVEKDRDILKRTNVVTTNAHYATKRVNNRGVVTIPTYAPTLNGTPTP